MLVGAVYMYALLISTCVHIVGACVLSLFSYSLYLLVLYRCKWVRVNGITCKLNCAVVCGITDEELTLGKVKYIYIMDCNQVVFEIKHFHVFIVECTSSYTIILLSMLISPFPLHLRRLNIHSTPLLAIIFKHHITHTLSDIV